MKKILYIVIGAAMLAGCSKEFTDEPNTTAKPGDPVTVTFGASVSGEVSEMSATQGADSPATRAFTSAYTGRIGVLNSSNAWETNCDDISLSITDAGAMTANPATLTSGQQYSFHSVAVPSGKTLPTKADSYNLAFGKVTDGVDLIYAKVAAQTINGGEKITFAYNHVYGKVKFVLSKGANVSDTQLAAATLTVSGYYASGSLDMKTGTITGTAGTDIAVDKDVEYYALPQTFAAGSEATAKVTIGAKTYVGKITAGNITADKLTTVTIKVNVEKTAPAKIGDYYYSDGTHSTAFSVPSGATLLGVVYEVNGNSGKLVEVTEGVGLTWGPDNTTTNAASTTDGQANMATIKAIPGWETAHPAFKHCADKNTGRVTGWYLPANDELLALYTTYNTYGKDVFSTLMTAASGVAFTTLEYWSSTENNSYIYYSWYVNFGSGGKYGNSKITSYRVRCVRAF